MLPPRPAYFVGTSPPSGHAEDVTVKAGPAGPRPPPPPRPWPPAWGACAQTPMVSTITHKTTITNDRINVVRMNSPPEMDKTIGVKFTRDGIQSPLKEDFEYASFDEF